MDLDVIFSSLETEGLVFVLKKSGSIAVQVGWSLER